MAINLVDCRNQHSLGINAHHLSRRQVHDCNHGLANQLLRLVILVNTAQNDAIFAFSVIQCELQELLALLHGFARQNLHRTEIRLCKRFKVHHFRENRLDLHVGEVDLRLLAGDGGRGLRRCFRRLLSLSGVDRLHRRDFKLTLFANQFFLIYLYFQSTFVSRPYYTFTPIRMSFVSSGVSIGVKWRM